MTLRRLLALVSALALTLIGAGATALEARAESYAGPCRDNLGVTVVVDYQGLGGGTVVRCAANFRPGGTGYQALQQAGFSTAGTFSDGPGFICRINNRPSRTETITVQGRSYKEDCRETPPAWAFWSYWHSPNGGNWSFSNFGVMNRKAIIGGYEGWSFSMGASAGSNPPPRVRPKHDAVTITSAPPTTKTAAPSPTTKPTPKVTPSAPVPSSPPGSTPAARPTPKHSATPSKRPSPTQSPSSAAPSVGRTPTVTPSTLTPTATASSPTSPSPTTSESSTPSPTASSPAQVTETVLPTATSAATTAPAAPELPAEGPGLGTFLGVGALASIAAVGGIVVWRRRRQL